MSCVFSHWCKYVSHIAEIMYSLKSLAKSLHFYCCCHRPGLCLSHLNKTMVLSVHSDLCYIQSLMLSPPHLLLTGESQTNGWSIIQKHQSGLSGRQGKLNQAGDTCLLFLWLSVPVAADLHLWQQELWLLVCMTTPLKPPFTYFKSRRFELDNVGFCTFSYIVEHVPFRKRAVQQLVPRYNTTQDHCCDLTTVHPLH